MAHGETVQNRGCPWRPSAAAQPGCTRPCRRPTPPGRTRPRPRTTRPHKTMPPPGTAQPPSTVAMHPIPMPSRCGALLHQAVAVRGGTEPATPGFTSPFITAATPGSPEPARTLHVLYGFVRLAVLLALDDLEAAEAAGPPLAEARQGAVLQDVEEDLAGDAAAGEDDDVKGDLGALGHQVAPHHRDPRPQGRLRPQRPLQARERLLGDRQVDPPRLREDVALELVLELLDRAVLLERAGGLAQEAFDEIVVDERAALVLVKAGPALGLDVLDGRLRHGLDLLTGPRRRLLGGGHRAVGEARVVDVAVALLGRPLAVFGRPLGLLLLVLAGLVGDERLVHLAVLGDGAEHLRHQPQGHRIAFRFQRHLPTSLFEKTVRPAGANAAAPAGPPRIALPHRHHPLRGCAATTRDSACQSHRGAV